ncbi:hypothetical protein DERF_009964 [Dermatophagoides farinae]|uniref:Uncharacterized protein n=1 Tax=Dermatophagoides farinae TaxID=6954 RepID=A0A922L4J2_DERFA|nr:hypothetical protein DERF_009964 [Dermatophagoides farinae]
MNQKGKYCKKNCRHHHPINLINYIFIEKKMKFEKYPNRIFVRFSQFHWNSIIHIINFQRIR